MSNTVQLPSSTEGKDLGGYKAFRISNGKIAIGRPADNTLEEYDTCAGVLHSVRRSQGVGDDGKAYDHYVAVMENLDWGKFTLKARVDGISGTMFAEILNEIQEPGQVVIIVPKKAKKPTKHGNYVTFVNGFDRDRRPIQTPEGKIEDRAPEALEAFMAHPLYKEPQKDEEDGYSDSPFGVVLETIKAKGWPSYDEATDALYLQMFAKALKVPSIDDPNDLTGDQCQSLVASIQKAPKCPQAIIDASESFDPFADE